MTPDPTLPRLSLVLLTWNEESNLHAALEALAKQTVKDFEVILIDAASTDRTLEIARAAETTLPVPLRIIPSPTKIPIGEARNLGVSLARAPLVAFASADAELDPTWIQHALEGLQRYDLVFGQQIHAPHKWTVGAAVRGLRYHFPTTTTTDPLRFASNVAAAYQKKILQAFPFDPWANAAEDLLLARRIQLAGYRVEYDPRLVARHHDVATTTQEFRKNLREGEGMALYSHELGILAQVLAWGFLLAATSVLALAIPSLWTLALFLVIPWIPAARRVIRRIGNMPTGPLLKGFLASPPFDLAFLFTYVRGLLGRNAAKKTIPTPTENKTP